MQSKPLDSESRNGKYTGVSTCLGGETLHDAVNGSKHVWCIWDDVKEFGRQSDEEQEQVWDGHAEEVVIRGGVHWLVSGNDDARAHVADDAADEDYRVDHENW